MAVQSDKLRLLRRIPQIRFEEELRGYSKSQVDRVLENLAPLADEIEVLQQHLAEAEQRAASAEAAAIQGGAPAPVVMDAPEATQAAAPQPPEDFDEQLREVMLMAQRTAKDRVETAEADAEQIRAESKSNADSLMASARTEAQELKAEAHAQREQMLAEAEEERAALLEAANADAEERRQAVEAQLVDSEGALRDDLLVEIKELRDKRAMLAEDLGLFENHLSDRRETVKAALGEIDNAINDPAKLRENALIEIADVPDTDEDQLTEISVESEALAELSGEAAKARDALAAASTGSAPEPEGLGVAVENVTGAEVQADTWTAPEVTPIDSSSPADDMFSTAAIDPVVDTAGTDFGQEDLGGSVPEAVATVPEGFVDPGMGDSAVADALANMDAPIADLGAELPDSDSLSGPDDQAADRPGGFFDTSAPEDGPAGWDAPPPLAAEPDPAPEPEEQSSRGGLLSGLLGGRRSADPAPQADSGDYLPPPSTEATAAPSEAMSGLRNRLSGADSAVIGTPADPPSLAEAAMNAVTENAPDATPADVGFQAPAAPEFDAPVQESSSPFGDLTRRAESLKDAVPDRPAWSDAVPESLTPPTPEALAGGSGDQYLDELRRVTGDDAVPDEDDEALNRFLSEDEDQGGGWFGRRK